MLLSILQCTKQPSLPSTKNDKAPKSNRAKVEEPCSSLNLQLACSCQCLLSAPCQKSKVLNLIKDQSHLPPRPLEPNTFFPDFCIGFPRWLSGKKKICLPRLVEKRAVGALLLLSRLPARPVRPGGGRAVWGPPPRPGPKPRKPRESWAPPARRPLGAHPVHHQLPDLAQTQVHRVGDAIRPSHALSSPSPPAVRSGRAHV